MAFEKIRWENKFSYNISDWYNNISNVYIYHSDLKSIFACSPLRCIYLLQILCIVNLYTCMHTLTRTHRISAQVYNVRIDYERLADALEQEIKLAKSE